MEIRLFEASAAKEKFALLIAKLHRAGLLIDYINDTMIRSPFFDCFEKNELDKFMTQSDETITRAVFKKEVIYDPSLNYVDEYYWAGLSVMSLMMNLAIPLKRILVLMPLKEVVGAYEVFHEMHPQRFLDHYAEKENERSLLKRLRKDKDLSISDIGRLTGIKTSALGFYDRSNAALFGASFPNLAKLSILLGVSIDAFRKESMFAPFSQYLLQSKAFEPILVEGILRYFKVKEGASYVVVDQYCEEKEIRKLLKDHKAIIDLSNPFGVIYVSSNRIRRRYLSKEEFLFLHKAAIEKLKARTNDLIF